MIEHLGDVGADREERVPERDGEVDHGEDYHADRDVGDRRAADAQTRRDPRGTSVPHADEEGEDARERASDGVDEEGEVDEDVVAAGVVDPEIEDADETVDDEGDQHHLAVSQREREREGTRIMRWTDMISLEYWMHSITQTTRVNRYARLIQPKNGRL